MGGLIPLSFGFPLALLGLALLPLIWWLLRVTPPRPNTEIFPPLKILARILKTETTPQQTPWWLLLIRLLMAAALIFAVAEPVWRPLAPVTSGSGPLAVIIDNGWASGPNAEAQQRTAESLIREASGNGGTVIVAGTVQAKDAAIGPFTLEQALSAAAAIKPVPVKPDRPARLTEIAPALSAGSAIAFLSDGIGAKDDAEAFRKLEAIKPSSFLWFQPDDRPVTALTDIQNGADALEIKVVRLGSGAASVVAAFDEKGRRIGEAPVSFAAGSASTTVALSAPFELRNDIQTISLLGEKTAAATRVVDDNLKRRRVALISGAETDLAQPLLSPLYYIRKAIEPFADIVQPQNPDIGSGLTELLETRPSAIIMADVGGVPQVQADALKKWIDEGGVLIRFAGPRLAAAIDDPFLPVRLRLGERALGGAMSWTEPQPVSEFPQAAPFAGLPVPQEVTVTRQVLAEPDPELAGKTWANLLDGTPLVTGEKRGKGSVVLFHVAPQATWSNLPISGTFVDMLRQTIMTARSASGEAMSAQGTALAPWRTIAADGTLGTAPADAKPLVLKKGIVAVASLENPPGLYGNEDGAVALNLMQAEDALTAATPPGLSVPVETRAYIGAGARQLKGLLLALAALLLFADTLAMTLMRRGGAVRKPAVAMAALALAFVLAGPFTNSRAHAQASDAKPGDDAAISAISQTRLASIKTGSDETDKVALEGLTGLTLFLRDKTALEPADPVAVDPETDELSFYPMLYWPVDPAAPMPSEKAIQRVNAYMQEGGSVLFDTRDQGGGDFSLSGDNSPANERLREILKDMGVPPLEPVPSDHVLTKSFFLLSDFVGRYRGSPLWVEQVLDSVSREDRPVRTGDGVSPILITGNDFASAWALTPDGRPMYPMENTDAEQRIYALRAGVNIMMYMLTGNYKSDQVHVPSLLERLGQ